MAFDRNESLLKNFRRIREIDEEVANSKYNLDEVVINEFKAPAPVVDWELLNKKLRFNE